MQKYSLETRKNKNKKETAPYFGMKINGKQGSTPEGKNKL